jgi:hypothetical protein
VSDFSRLVSPLPLPSILLALPNTYRNFRYLLKVNSLAFCLMGFWILPLLGYSPFTTRYNFIWVINSWKEILPVVLWPCIGLAAAFTLYKLARILVPRWRENFDHRVGLLWYTPNKIGHSVIRIVFKVTNENDNFGRVHPHSHPAAGRMDARELRRGGADLTAQATSSIALACFYSLTKALGESASLVTLYGGAVNEVTLRGYKFRDVGPKDSLGEPIGGNSYWMGSIEYSLPIIERLRVAAFYDIGTVNAESWDFGASHYADNWGIGLRIHGPGFTALRLEAAKSREGWRVLLAEHQVF